MRRLPLLVSLCFVFGTACAQDPDDLPEGPAIAYEPAFPAQAGFDRPLFVAFAPNDPDMAYVVTQPGQVFRIPRDGSKADRQTFLDLAGKVFTENMEEGLLGFPFDPDYAQNHFVYLCWSERIEPRKELVANGKEHKSNRQSVIARYEVKTGDAGPVVDLQSELRLLESTLP